MWLLDNLEKLRHSTNTAIVYRENGITFFDLWNRSERMAAVINTTCHTKAPVVIYGNKDIEINVAMLGVLKSGRAYVPVDITFPVERLLQIASMVNCELLLNFSDVEIQNFTFDIFDKDSFNSHIDEVDVTYESNKLDWVKADDDCYILFTSGSTGIPKGVPIKRRNIENFISWIQPYGITNNEKNVILNQISYSFDVSVIALYFYLPMGNTLFNIDKVMLENFQELFKYLGKSDIAVWVSTPSFLEICNFDSHFDDHLLPNLEKFILAGEVLSKKLVASVNDKFVKATVINGYGPTEGTVLFSICEITDQMMRQGGSLPIGRVIPEADYCIVDGNGDRVVAGEVGELIVVSKSVSRGYYNNPKRTQEVFFVAEDGRMGYRTGDLVFEKDKLLYYVSRKDFQIKYNGFRIELDDIANNLNKIKFINGSVVSPVYREDRIQYLVAFVVLSEHLEMSGIKIKTCIKNELKKLVPSYMIPKKIIIVEQFPLNTNGKVDRKKLMEAL